MVIVGAFSGKPDPGSPWKMRSNQRIQGAAVPATIVFRQRFASMVASPREEIIFKIEGPADGRPSHRERRQISAENEDQIVGSVTLLVFFAGNRFDALPVAEKSVRQARVFAVAGAPVPQRFVRDLAEDMRGAVFHREIDALEPLELELLVIPDQWHENLEPRS